MPVQVHSTLFNQTFFGHFSTLLPLTHAEDFCVTDPDHIMLMLPVRIHFHLLISL